MKKVFLIFQLLVSIILSIKVENYQKEILLLKNIKNNFRPFKMKSETELDIYNKYYLKTKCEKNKIEKINFNILGKELCKEELIFGFEEINFFLENLFLELKNDFIFENFFIDYEISFLNKKKIKEKIIFRQNFKTAKIIPIDLKILVLNFKEKKEKNFLIEILEIKKNYLKNSKNNFELKIIKNDLPKFINYNFQNGKLFFFGKFPEKKKNLNFSFYIFDNKTKLISETQIFYFEKEKIIFKNIKNFIFLIIIIISILFIFFILSTFFYLKKKKKNF